MMQRACIASLAALVGCASPSAIAPYGKDSYIVTVDDALGGHSPGRLQVRAAEEANRYCTNQGKVLRVENSTNKGAFGWTSTASTLVFSCVNKE